MNEENLHTTNIAGITGVGLISCYVEDFQKALPFYMETLGLTDWNPMGSQAGAFTVSDETTLFVIGGKNPSSLDRNSVRCTFAFSVDSVSAFTDRLKQAGAELVFEPPMQMNDETWWIQFHDPAGNLLEAIGGK